MRRGTNCPEGSPSRPRRRRWLGALAGLALLAPAGLLAHSPPDPLQHVLMLPRMQASIYQVLTQIADSIGYTFVYDGQVVRSDQRVRIPAGPVTVEQALRGILNDPSLALDVMGQHILIRRRAGEPHAPSPPPAQDTLAYVTVGGRVLDAQTHQPLPFATVGILEAGLGNVANADGVFVLRVPEPFHQAQLTVSHLGYRSRAFPMGVLANQTPYIFLEVSEIPIPEVVVRNVEPRGLVAEAIRRIGRNYSQQATHLTTFYREGVTINSKLLNFSEAIFRVHKPPYTLLPEADQAKLIRSRTLTNVDHTDTLLIKLKGGISSSLALDIVRNTPSFLHPDEMALYRYYKTDIVTIGSRLAYAIGFEQHEHIREPLFRGTLYIDMESLAILQAEFEVHPAWVEMTAADFVSKTARGYIVRPQQVSYSVRYMEFGGTLHIGHVRGDLRFRYRQRRRLRQNHFTAFLEMVTSRIDTANVRRFDREEVIAKERVFMDLAGGYDAEFWGNLNFIAPEERIEYALPLIRALVEETLGGGGAKAP